MKKILLGQLHANGDCLYATAIARQIKTDYPGCHLTWAISSLCVSILDGNPYVDEVWEVQMNNTSEMGDTWARFSQEALERQKQGEFDEVYLTQIRPGNLQNFDGTVRSSIFRAYPRPITVPIAPVLKLTATEVENVRQFAQTHNLDKQSHVILFECAPKSGQSLVSPNYALNVAKQLVSRIPNLCVILSSNISIDSDDARIISGSVLSFRENAELTKYCTLLVGCSSGISWLCTSDWAKPLPMIQIINPFVLSFASFINDHKYFNLPIDSIIEMENCSEEQLVECVDFALCEGFNSARLKFNELILFNYYAFIVFFFRCVIHGEFRGVVGLVKSYYQRHGLTINTIKSFSPKFFTAVFKKTISYYFRQTNDH